jgi:hypothetical protein
MFLAALVSLLLPALAAQSPAPAVRAGPAALQRPVVVGASLSYGLGLDQKHENGVRTSLADVAQAALEVEHQRVVDLGHSLMFLNTTSNARQLIDSARDQNPTLVVALDFLFWFGYGEIASEDARLAMLERGLGQLEGFDCPVLVGDFPDMQAALRGKSHLARGGPLLMPAQVPAPETLAKLNAKLAAWAAERPNVVLVPLSEFVAKLHTAEKIEVRGNTFGGKDGLATLMQPDLLHPTLRGTVGVWILAADRLVTAKPEIPADAFLWNAEELRQRVWNAKEQERRDAAEKARKRAEKAAPPPPPEPDPPAAEKKSRRGGGERDGDGG